MKKILLSLGAMAAVAAPVAVAVSCNDDTEAAKTEFQKIADQMKAITPVASHGNATDEYGDYVSYSLTWVFPKTFGLSSDATLEKIESEVNKLPGFNNTDFDFSAGTYKSSGATTDDHIEFTLYSSNRLPRFAASEMTAANTSVEINKIVDVISKLTA